MSRLKLGDLEISFVHDLQAFSPQVINAPQVTPSSNVSVPPAPTGVATEKVEGMVVPQDLDEEMDFDKVLFHSAPDDGGSIPLTGDQPLGEPELARETIPNG